MNATLVGVQPVRVVTRPLSMFPCSAHRPKRMSGPTVIGCRAGTVKSSNRWAKKSMHATLELSSDGLV
jgi:hypothetical protein